MDLTRVELAWVGLDGSEEGLLLDPTDHPDVRISPDARQIAYTRDDHIHLFDLDRGTNQRLTFEGENHHDPVWSPDGRTLAFASVRPEGRGQTDIYVKAVDGRSAAEWVAGLEGQDYPADWLPDGTLTLFRRANVGAPADIYMARTGSGEDPVPLLRADWDETAPKLSPDGALMAYVSDETGEPHVFVREFPDMRGRWQVSAAPAVAPLVWSRDGRALF